MPDAWVHVDGAFGLWAAAAPGRAHLVEGVPDADSWTTDAHKWLNVPYDSGLAFVRDPLALRAAMGQSDAYYVVGDQREPMQYTSETSRRGRSVEVWAALRSLGRSGLADLVERTCCLAAGFAEGLKAAGYEVLNDVILNQVLVAFGFDEQTRRVIEAVQRDGTCWCDGTVCHGRGRDANQRLQLGNHGSRRRPQPGRHPPRRRLESSTMPPAAQTGCLRSLALQ